MKDSELVRLVSSANTGKLGNRREWMPITIQVNGQIVAGELISAKDFAALVASDRRHATVGLSPSDPNVDFLHMRRARVSTELVAQEWPEGSGALYRCRIDAVVAFVLP